MLVVINIILLNNKVLEYKIVNKISEYVGNLVSSYKIQIMRIQYLFHKKQVTIFIKKVLEWKGMFHFDNKICKIKYQQKLFWHLIL